MKQLNFLFILIDDMGWSDLGCQGSPFYETPNIDKLAQDGVRFTQAYAAAPVCSATRASIMTGRYPARLHLTDWLPGRGPGPESKLTRPETNQQLPLEEVTIAEALRPMGYICAGIGKWHLGGEGFLPQDQGFDVNIGGTNCGMPRSYFYPAWDGKPVLAGEPGEYLTDRLTNEAVGFIQAHKDRSFFLMLSHYAVHIPMEAKPGITAKYRARSRPDQFHNNPVYAAMIEGVDESVGRVMATLETLGIAERTVVIFTSDNGGLHVEQGPHTPATSNYPLRAGKGHLYEGGIREPLIIRWPGVVEPGSVSDEVVCSNDFLPMIVEMAGGEHSVPVDGLSLVSHLRDGAPIDRDTLYWHYPHYSGQGGRPSGSIRRGVMKLVEHFEDGRLELFDLDADIGEQNDLADKMPDVVSDLRTELIEWRASVDAQMPTPNPDFAG